MLPFASTSSAGISSRNRDGGLYCVEPNRLRLQAWVMYSRSRARVMPTYASRRSSSSSSGSVSARTVREDALLDADEEHDGELEPLGRVQRHQHDLVLDLAVGQVVGVGDQRHLLEELVDLRELACRADQLAEVLQPSRRLDRVFGLQLGQVAGALERGLQQVARPDAAALDLAGGPLGRATIAPRSSSSTTNDSMPRTAGPVTPASSA